MTEKKKGNAFTDNPLVRAIGVQLQSSVLRWPLQADCKGHRSTEDCSCTRADCHAYLL